MEQNVKSKKYSGLLAASIFLSATMFIIAPIIVYVTNKSEFWFDFGNFWWIILLCGLVGFGVFYGIGRLFSGKALNVYCCLIFGIGFAVFLQGNFLSTNVGQLNGMHKNWALFSDQFTLNLIIFAIVSILPAILCIFFEKALLKLVRFAPYFLVGVQVILLVMSAFTAPGAYKKPLSDKDYFKLSKDENIILLVVDMLDSEYAKRAVEEIPEIKDSLDGFTFYENSGGKYSSTHYSFSLFLNGNLNLNGGNVFENENSKVYFDMLRNDGYSIEAYCHTRYLSEEFYTSLDNNVEYPALQVNDNVAFAGRLYSLTGFRYLPDVLKPFFWFDAGIAFSRYVKIDGEINASMVFNDYFYDRLTREEIELKDSGKSYKLYYIFGNHFPYYTTAEARFSPEEVKYFETTKGVFRIIEEFLSQIKSAGIYDDSTIVITADHGWIGANALTSPTLMIKPKGSRGEMLISDTPVDNTVIVPSILQSAGLDYSLFGTPASVPLTGRKVYNSGLLVELGYVSDLIEYTVADENNNSKSFIPTGYKFNMKGEYVSIYSYNKYTPGTKIDLSGMKCQYFDLGFAVGESWSSEAHLTMTLPEVRDYEVNLTLKEHFGGSQRLIITCEGEELYSGKISQMQTIKFTIPSNSIKDGKVLIKLLFPDAFAIREIDKDSDDAVLRAFDFYDMIVN